MSDAAHSLASPDGQGAAKRTDPEQHQPQQTSVASALPCACPYDGDGDTVLQRHPEHARQHQTAAVHSAWLEVCAANWGPADLQPDVGYQGASPIEHQWLVPFAGDWHFLVHVCTAIFSIWWEQVLEPLCQFVPRFGMARSMKLSAWPVYDEVLKIVAQAMLEWLTEIGGDADLQDPLELLQQCDNNRAVSTCLGFLFHGAIFYVQLQGSSACRGCRHPGLGLAVCGRRCSTWPVSPCISACALQ